VAVDLSTSAIPMPALGAVARSSPTRCGSASANTTNGSEPPNSSTDFLISRPAIAPTALPARSLPVMVTAPIRGSAMSRSVVAGTSASATNSVVNKPSGKPAVDNTSWHASADPVVFGECLSRPALPAIRAGAANRKTCHSGKFHGITARTTPTGS
jgi:hypothetical protein